ncbi:ComF family protein [Prevotella sp.]|uniref:ComF family protein n=1 Tax=Prevotella sp. TaxID=59823 RepID=UPI002F932A84
MKINRLTRLIDLLAPRPCAVCGRRLTAEEHSLCLDCLLHLPFTGYEQSPRDNEMARLFWGHIDIEKAVALFFYAPHAPASNPIYELKYHHRPQYGYQLGLLMGQRLAPTGFFDDIDGLMAVPLSADRRRHRGYNQSDLIAQGLSDATGISLIKGALVRTTFNGSQTQQPSVLARRENVENAFCLKRPSAVAGRHLLLVDDVVTTGATLHAVAATLAAAGGVRFSVASLAFAPK